MGDLYLSPQEANILRYATLFWGILQWWDMIDRYLLKRKPSTTTASRGASNPHRDAESNPEAAGAREGPPAVPNGQERV